MTREEHDKRMITITYNAYIEQIKFVSDDRSKTAKELISVNWRDLAKDVCRGAIDQIKSDYDRAIGMLDIAYDLEILSDGETATMMAEVEETKDNALMALEDILKSI